MTSSLYPPGCNGTPFDDEIDPIEEGENFTKRFGDSSGDEDIDYAVMVIESLLEYIDEQR